MELGGVDMVLAMEWLSGLGWIAANFQELTMRWKENGKERVLQGDPALSKAKASWKATLKAFKADGEGYFITPASGESEPTLGIRVLAET